MAIVVFFIHIPVLHGQSSEKKTVVFVCEHGAARSLIASSYFNKLAEERNLTVRSVFRGLNPDSTLSVVAQKGLQVDGISVQGLRPSSLTRQDVHNAIQVIALDCTVPPANVDNQKQSNWKVQSSISNNYESARDEIKKKVEELINELAKRQ